MTTDPTATPSRPLREPDRAPVSVPVDAVFGLVVMVAGSER